MQIIGLQKFTLIDYPDKLACTVFFGGCNYRCGFCYNPELVLPERIKEHTPLKPREVFKFLKERKSVLEGVCIGGGEPTCQNDLPAFCRRAKKLDYLVKLDTNGSNPEMLGSLISRGLVDYVAMDVKAPQEKYLEVIGLAGCVDNYFLKRINQSIDILKRSKIDHEFRTTMVPGLVEKEDIVKIVKWISPAKRYCLQSFKPEKTLNPSLRGVRPKDADELLIIKEAIAPLFDDCQVR